MAYNQNQWQQPPPYAGYAQPGPGYIPPPAGSYPQQPGFAPQPGYGGGYAQPQSSYPPQPGFQFPSDHQEPKPDDARGYANDISGFEFDDRTIRAAFIKKVYSILSVQLLVTVGFIVLFLKHKPLKDYTYENPWLLIVAIVMTFVLILVMACCDGVRRKSPHNFVCLGLFTIAEGFLLGAISSRYTGESVLMAVGVTTAICMGLTLFAFQTKWDFTGMGTYLFVILLVFILFGFIAMFFPQTRAVRTVYSAIGALIFSLYLVYDTQLMMGGKHKYSLSPEEYIFAALNLYLDVVNIFLYILSLLGDRS